MGQKDGVIGDKDKLTGRGTRAAFVQKTIIKRGCNFNRKHFMSHKNKLIIYPVKDGEKAKAFYGKFLE
jgi:hypothetical protein